MRNKTIILLSAKAGLRAGEIAKLTWDMVTDPTGTIGTICATLQRRGSCKLALTCGKLLAISA
ncbi:MAG: hypothetical protein ABSE50_19515 [Xanthobacteraceae bacterium]